MDSFEINKILGAVLGTLLFVMGAGFIAEAIYQPGEAPGVGYALPEPEGGAGEGGPAAPADEPLGVRLAAANAEAGHAAVRKCESCHTFEAGGANKAGPNLYDIVDQLIGHHADFSYSAGMLEHKTAGDTWTYDNLDHFLKRPKGFTPGTKMTFAGIRNAQERADVLAYLQSLSADPKPFPPPEPVAEAAPAADATATPTTTQDEMSVVGTPTDDETPAGAEVPAQPTPEPAVTPAEPPVSAAPAAQ